jgi:hypothetical protein
MHNARRTALSVLESVWLMPLSIFIFCQFGIEVLCIHEKCALDHAAGDEVPRQFVVMVQSEAGLAEVEAVLLRQLGNHLAQSPGRSLRLRAASGKDGNWDYAVVSDDGRSQVISARYFDNYSISETYRATGEEVWPLTSKITSVGYLFSVLPFAWMAALGIRKLAQWQLRKAIP